MSIVPKFACVIVVKSAKGVFTAFTWIIKSYRNADKKKKTFFAKLWVRYLSLFLSHWAVGQDSNLRRKWNDIVR